MCVHTGTLVCVGVLAGDSSGEGGPQPQFDARSSMTASRSERVLELTGAVIATSFKLHITWSISLRLVQSSVFPVH